MRSSLIQFVGCATTQLSVVGCQIWANIGLFLIILIEIIGRFRHIGRNYWNYELFLYMIDIFLLEWVFISTAPFWSWVCDNLYIIIFNECAIFLIFIILGRLNFWKRFLRYRSIFYGSNHQFLFLRYFLFFEFILQV